MAKQLSKRSDIERMVAAGEAVMEQDGLGILCEVEEFYG